MSKERIKNTVITYWSAENETFVAESSMIPHVVIGIGDSKEAAIEDFEGSLEEAYSEIASDNVAGYKTGRPAKGLVALNLNVRPASKLRIDDLAKQLDITKGEVVDYLLFFYECKLGENNCVPAKDALVQSLNAITERISSMESELKILRAEQRPAV